MFISLEVDTGKLLRLRSYPIDATTGRATYIYSQWEHLGGSFSGYAFWFNTLGNFKPGQEQAYLAFQPAAAPVGLYRVTVGYFPGVDESDLIQVYPDGVVDYHLVLLYEDERVYYTDLDPVTYTLYSSGQETRYYE